MADVYNYTPRIDNHQMGWCWGNNDNGVNGDNSTVDRLTPVAVCGNHTFIQIVRDLSHSIALDKNGKAWAWGWNNRGELGCNNTTQYSTPIAVCGNHTFVFVQACQMSERLSMALDNHGKMWGWGYGARGKVGDNTTTDRCTPVAVCGNHTFVHINYNQQGFSSQNNTTAIDNHGMAWSWGGNSQGVLGDNAEVDRLTPVAVCGGHTFSFISVSDKIAMGVDINGVSWSWGNDTRGALGHATWYVNTCTPQAVCGSQTFAMLAVGTDAVGALDINGKAWSWGRGSESQLGQGNLDDQSTPVAVYGTKTFCSIFQYRAWFQPYPAILIDPSGKGWGWGYNDRAGLGDNSTVNKCSPVAICGNHTFLFIQSGSVTRRRSPGGGVAYGWSFTY